MTDAELTDLSTKLGTSGDGGGIACSNADSVWTMELSCMGSLVWSDTSQTTKQLQCSCNNGNWEEITEQCKPDGNTTFSNSYSTFSTYKFQSAL